MEAAWRLQEYPMCGRSHSVFSLPVHLENKQKIVFEENKVEKYIDKFKTSLLSWFDLNKIDDFAINIKYANIPEYYTFDKKKKDLE